MKKVIVRLKGGLGNQLFCYAVARRLALKNQAELIIDDKTGFIRDATYNRHYALAPFNIDARKATKWERMEPFERYRRGISKFIAKHTPYEKRRYLESKGLEFDELLLGFQVDKTVYLDGLWFSEDYFKDVEQEIRNDLKIAPPYDLLNLNLAHKINSCNAVSLHVRWFDDPKNVNGKHNASADYYARAVDYMDRQLTEPHYFVFSDDPIATKEKIALPTYRTTFVNHNTGDKSAYIDLWLMTQCKHFIIANSTFSWWGAWLASYESKIIICPNLDLVGLTAWGFPGLIPNQWIKL